MAVRYLVLEWYAPDQVLDGALRSLADMYGGWLFLFLLEPILLAAHMDTPGVTPPASGSWGCGYGGRTAGS